MSYSFSVKATSKREAKLAVSAEFHRIVADKPQHAHDAQMAVRAAHALIDLLDDNPALDVCVGMYGTLTMVHGEDAIVGAGLHANVYLTPRT